MSDPVNDPKLVIGVLFAAGLLILVMRASRRTRAASGKNGGDGGVYPYGADSGSLGADCGHGGGAGCGGGDGGGD